MSCVPGDRRQSENTCDGHARHVLDNDIANCTTFTLPRIHYNLFYWPDFALYQGGADCAPLCASGLPETG